MEMKNLSNNILIYRIFICLFAINSLSSKVDAKNDNDNAEPYQALARTSLSFINDSLCIIDDPENSLYTFISELYSLCNGKDTVINIVHIGDSHMQAGFLSGTTMRLLQKQFGNAGRGWVSPLKLSKTNEPTDYFITSNVKNWFSGKCIQRNPFCPWGIGGMGIATPSGDFNFDIRIAPNNGAGYSFNQAIIFRDMFSYPLIPLNTEDTVACQFGIAPMENMLIDTISTYFLKDTLMLKSVIIPMTGDYNKNAFYDTYDANNNNLYYGFVLKNGMPGILYHSIGINGARFVDFSSREYIRQLSILKPSLLIASFGTNESFVKIPDSSVILQELDSFVRLVREELPNTVLLITTPAESFKRVYKNKKRGYIRNENISIISEIIKTYTGKQGIACWDLFGISGGKDSGKYWLKANMFGRDRIHFSREGYEEQGKLLYNSLVRSWINEQNIEQALEEKLISEEDLNDDNYKDNKTGGFYENSLDNQDKFNEKEPVIDYVDRYIKKEVKDVE
jgi:lysophospholipase L1-like esterase